LSFCRVAAFPGLRTQVFVTRAGAKTPGDVRLPTILPAA
jgi:hypothetical protein